MKLPSYMEQDGRIGIKVSLTGMEQVKSLTSILKSMMEDEQIPLEVRKRYKKRVENEVLGERSQ